MLPCECIFILLRRDRHVNMSGNKYLIDVGGREKEVVFELLEKYTINFLLVIHSPSA